MIIVVNKNKKTNEFIPVLSTYGKSIEELKQEIKKQLIQEIMNNPTSLKAYKEIEVYKIGEIGEQFEIKIKEKEKIADYEEILEEIIEILIKENEGEKKSD